MRPARWIWTAAAVCAACVCGCAGSADRIDAYNRYGVHLAEHGLWKEAAFRWEQAAALGGNAKVWNNLGAAYEAAEKYDDALKAYERALSLDPNNKHYIQNLRMAEMNKQRAGRAAAPPNETESTDSCEP